MKTVRDEVSETDDGCPMDIFRLVSGLPDAVETIIPVDLLAGGLGINCLSWLAQQNGTLADGLLTLTLHGRDEAEVVTSSPHRNIGGSGRIESLRLR